MKQDQPLPRANRLIYEKSPYLLQHAHNPVDWYPWGEEAFERARAEKKPIFLSIGYSTCHWCHVMERESFEDEETARFLNERFVSIKVDREELPDVDDLYMTAVQAMTGQGGWPLNVFLTPDLKPFYGGTYFPPVDLPGRPSFRTVLRHVANAWETKRETVTDSAGRIVEALFPVSSSTQPPENGVSPALFDAAYRELSGRYDQENGGFGSAPKFPQAPTLSFLLLYGARTSNQIATEMVLHTLRKMAAGGIYDHLGGGFHRYSTDSRWLVPHFEKMLCDNALLAALYLDAFRITKENGFLTTALETLDYVLRDMTSPEGGFYTAEDADSEGAEGKFYTWTSEEIGAVLGDHADAFCRRYGVTGKTDFDGEGNILRLAESLEDVASAVRVSPSELERRFKADRKRLLKARSERVRPALDDKILTSWNGLMISAMAIGYQVSGDERYLNAARSAADFVLSALTRGSRLLRRYRDGEAGMPASLDDYAYLIAGLLDLYQAEFDPRRLMEAKRLAQVMLADFQDEAGGFFSATGENSNLIARPKHGHDSSLPSANAVAAADLYRLSRYFEDGDFVRVSRRAVEALDSQIRQAPQAFCALLSATDLHLVPPLEVVLAGDGTKRLLRVIWEQYLPNSLIALAAEADDCPIPLLAKREPLDGRPTAYVCAGSSCRPPVTDPVELKKVLAAQQ